MENGKPKLIMVVDDNATNLLAAKAALQDYYKVLTAGSAAIMMQTLEMRKPDLILLDVDMPEMGGFEAIQILKENPDTVDIPVIFLTAMNDSGNELKGLELGAVDFISKPFSPPLLRKRIELHLLLESQNHELQGYANNLEHMVQEKTKTILKLQNTLLEAIAEAVESRDGTTGEHIARTRHFMHILITAAIEAGKWPEETAGWDIEMLCQSCQLHDVGKIAISDSILKKPGRLDAEEIAEMQKHSAIGAAFIARLEDSDSDNAFLHNAKIFAENHHEKWNGTGYPNQLSGNAIPLLGRMMAIADVYDALTSDRPYKKAFSHDEAFRIILEGKGSHFDPELVELFEQVAEQFRI
jgi:putative two-component system response regulator